MFYESRLLTPKVKLALSVIAIVISSTFLVLTMTPYNIATTPDSISYLDAAQHIRAGDGLVLTNYVYGDERETTPFTVWPPLYPTFLALFPSIESNPLFSAVQASILTLVINCLLILFILRKLTGDGLALIAVIVYMFSSANIIISSYAWSEPLFIKILLISILFTLSSYKASVQQNTKSLFFHLIMLATALAGVFYTRYIGLIFGFALPLTWLLAPNKKEYFKYYIVALLWFFLLISALLLRNYLIGDITGGDVLDRDRSASTKSVWGNGYAVLDSLYLLIPNNYFITIAVIVAGLVAINFLKFKSVALMRKKQNTDTFNNQKTFLIWMLIAYIVVYLGFLIILRSITSFEEIRVRYIAVISPLILMLLVIFISNYRCSYNSSWLRANKLAICFVLLILVVIQGGLIIKQSKENLAVYGAPNMPLTGTQTNKMYSQLTGPAKIVRINNFVKQIGMKDDDLVLIERPKLFAFITGLKFRRFKGGISKKNLLNLMEKNDKGFLILNEEKSKNIWKEFSNTTEDLNKIRTIVIPLPLLAKVNINQPK